MSIISDLREKQDASKPLGLGAFYDMQIFFTHGDTYKGYEYCVLKHYYPNWPSHIPKCIQNPSGVGYVSLPVGHVIRKKVKMNDYFHPLVTSLDVHGGVTYYKHPSFSFLSTKYKDEVWIGFDAKHIDSPNYDKDFMIAECRKLIDQLVDM